MENATLSTTERHTRSVPISGGIFVAVVVLGGGALQGWAARRYVVNLSASMPRGVYQLHALSNPVRRGEIVAVCLPEEVSRLGRERGYLGRGPCHGSQGVLKYVAAVTGDTVHMAPHGVTVNGYTLPHSAVVAHDRAGRSVPHVAFGLHTMPPGAVWLVSAETTNGWDSRYYGPVGVAGVVATAKRVFP